MSTELETLRSELARAKREEATAVARAKEIESKVCNAESKQFIESNRITREQVQLSSGDGMPFFATIGEFISWMRATGNTKPWAEWNDSIYNAARLRESGGITRDHEAPGMMEHLPKENLATSHAKA